MFKSIHSPLATTRAPIFIAIVVTTFAGALAVLLSGMPDVKAGLQTKAAPVSQARPKADRLPIFAKGATPSGQGLRQAKVL